MLEQTELLLWCFKTGCCLSWEAIHTDADMHPDQLPLSVMQTQHPWACRLSGIEASSASLDVGSSCSGGAVLQGADS